MPAGNPTNIHGANHTSKGLCMVVILGCGEEVGVGEVGETEKQWER